MSRSAAEVLSRCGAVVAIEIVKLPRHYDDDPEALVSGFGGRVLARATGREVGQVLRGLTALAPAEQMRCHLPVYCLRLREASEQVLEIAICFECNNARTRYAGLADWFTFDGASSTAKTLLDLMLAADPDVEASHSE